jgi:hypothetical protein
MTDQHKIDALKKRVADANDKLCINDRRIKKLTELLHRTTGKTITLQNIGL